MPETSITQGDLVTFNGRTYIALDTAERMVRDALDKVRPFESEWLTVKQAAQLAGRSLSVIYDAARRGEVEARIPHGVSRGMRLSRSSVERWMVGREYGKGATDAE